MDNRIYHEAYLAFASFCVRNTGRDLVHFGKTKSTFSYEIESGNDTLTSDGTGNDNVATVALSRNGEPPIKVRFFHRTQEAKA